MKKVKQIKTAINPTQFLPPSCNTVQNNRVTLGRQNFEYMRPKSILKTLPKTRTTGANKTILGHASLPSPKKVTFTNPTKHISKERRTVPTPTTIFRLALDSGATSHCFPSSYRGTNHQKVPAHKAFLRKLQMMK